MTRTHELKIEQHYLDDLMLGSKTFELRLNDRNYQKGDVLKFLNPSHGANLTYFNFTITSVFSGSGTLGLKNGWVILSLRKKSDES